MFANHWQELTSDPQLFVGGASRLDIQQGDLGEQTLLLILLINTLFSYSKLFLLP